MELILTLTYLIDGVPMVYCGNELADEKRLSMFANRFYKGEFEFTDRDDKTSEASLRRQGVIKKLNTLRRESETLARGTTEWLDTEHSDKVVCFKRALNGEEITVIGNLSRETVTVTVPNIGGKVILESKSTRKGDEFILNPFGYSVLKEK
jgi:glycosidase